MKNIFLLLVALSSFMVAQATPNPEASASPSSARKAAKEARQARRAARNQGPELYKGQMAQRVRLITDAVGAEDDQDPQEETPAKVSRKQARLNNARPAADMQAAAQR